MNRRKVFISYSHKDKNLFCEFKTMLAPAIAGGIVQLWDDTQIRPGTKWREEIANALASTRVAVLLVSSNFLASEFIAKNELPPLLKAAEQDGATIFWVYLSSCLYEQTKIANYQAAHDIAKPLDQLSKPKRQAILSELCARLIRLAETPVVGAPASGGVPGGTPAIAEPSTPHQPTEVPEDVYLDRETRLMWTKEDNGKDLEWNEAKDYAFGLSLGGYKDWRLPTIEELEDLYAPGREGEQKIRSPFRLTSLAIWSSVKQAPGSGWFFSFENGVRLYNIYGSQKCRALCVRGPMI